MKPLLPSLPRSSGHSQADAKLGLSNVWVRCSDQGAMLGRTGWDAAWANDHSPTEKRDACVLQESSSTRQRQALQQADSNWNSSLPNGKDVSSQLVSVNLSLSDPLRRTVPEFYPLTNLHLTTCSWDFASSASRELR